jgi:hypothetical protein
MKGSDDNAQAQHADPKAEPLRITLRLGTAPTEQPFRTTGAKNKALRKKLREWKGSESDLIRWATELSPSDTPDVIARDGALARAKTIIATIEGELLKSSKNKSTRGIVGSADERLAIARDKLLAQGYKPADIKPTLLRNTAEPKVGNHYTASTFIQMDPILKGAGNRVARGKTAAS